MKKLMIAVAVVLTAVASQAASANWRIGAAKIFAGTGSTASASDKFTGTAYFFDAAVIAQDALFTAYKSDSGYIAANAIGTKAVSAGSITQTSAIDMVYGDGGSSYNLYFVCINGDAVYFSNVKTATGNAASSGGTLAFGNQNATTSATAPTFSSLAPQATFASGHWVTAVPEPTSGLMLILGVGLMALKRKRA